MGSEAYDPGFSRAYGGLRPSSVSARGGLAPWQEKRAKELLEANIDGDLPLAQLAAECQLSKWHFSRAFRQATGRPVSMADGAACR
jgi:AraC family transcriptional regulator